MKFSIVIPTRNRLALVKDAVDSVVRQSYANWEVIVFDNGSDEPVGEYVDSLADSRIRYERSREFLPVTDSWNTAIDFATGDYVMLIGDDDGLTPGYFDRAIKLIDIFKAPDMIYSALYQFIHPGVAAWELGGYVDEVRNAAFFKDLTVPALLTAEERKHAISGSLDLRRNFVFNMQSFLFSKDFIAKIRRDGVVFHSPFPDYYLANLVMEIGERVLADPEPTAIAGVSKASFGFTLLNNQEARGAALLKSDWESDPLYPSCRDLLLPGPAYNTSYVLTMAHLRRQLGETALPPVNFARYRRIQSRFFIDGQHGRLTWMRTPAGKAMWDKLSWRERLWATDRKSVV